MDDAVNGHLLENNVTQTRFVASSSCRYLAPLQYPQPVSIGLGLTKLGKSSAAYTIGIFSHPATRIEGGPTASSALQLCAEGTFVHVYVDSDGRPTTMSAVTRAVLEPLLMAE